MTNNVEENQFLNGEYSQFYNSRISYLKKAVALAVVSGGYLQNFANFNRLNDLKFSLRKSFPWFKSKRLYRVAVSKKCYLWKCVTKKARNFAKTTKISNFKANNGWLNKFCLRHKIAF